MMTLIGMAVTAAYAFSALVALGPHGKAFFWEPASPIDVMLLGY